jgi:hypothetical protein
MSHNLVCDGTKNSNAWKASREEEIEVGFSKLDYH